MRTPDTAELLRVWEQGANESTPVRALLLTQAAAPDVDGETLLHCNIGRRDHVLINLRDALFGPDIHCLTDCTHCGEAIELDFRVDDIRVPHGVPGHDYHARAEGYDVRFRLPDSSDLLALQAEPPAQAERRLLERCVLKAWTDEGDTEVAALPNAVLSAVSREMGEADPQAEVVLEVACPACSAVSPALFDIVAHLWAEVDVWARRVLREVHALAAAYGWSETEILCLTAARRRAYLNLIGGY